MLIHFITHQDTGKSHNGCAIVLGNAGPLFSKPAKQKIVTKSSTGAELVGLSDTAIVLLYFYAGLENRGPAFPSTMAHPLCDFPVSW